MTIPEIAVVDFESGGIKPRPQYPPRSCGVAIREPGVRSYYLAHRHPCENNSTFTKNKRTLKRVCDKYAVVFHNAKFDLEILWEEYKIFPKIYHDTQALAFLHNPYAKTLSLKPLAEQLFDLPPDEQDALRDWILENVEGTTTNRKSDMYWAGYIDHAPGKLVGRYAIGDVNRTYKVFRYLWPIVIGKYKMTEAYAREIRLVPPLVSMEKKGVYTKSRQLKTAITKFERNQNTIDARIRRRIKVGKNFNLDKKEPFADALQSCGAVDSFIYTTGPKTGKKSRSVSKDNLAAVINDNYLLHMILIRSKLKTFLQTFLRPWYEIGKQNNGFMYSQFASTRASGYGKEIGAKSGRITSSQPNFFNVPKDVDVPDGIPKIEQNLYSLLPFMRNYIWPDPGKMFITRDVSQQELRILANYEYDVLYDEYLKNPFLDIHDLAQKMISEMLGIEIPRKPIKTIGFSIIYGIGIALLAKNLNLPLDKTQELKDAYLAIFPGIGPLIKELKQLERNNDYLRTWGSRVYYTEPPAMIKGRMRKFGYKMLNYLIQPSAADQTKEFFIRASEAGLDVRIVLYDQLLANANPKTWRDEMETMREIIEGIEFDIFLLSEGKFGSSSWGQMRKFKDVR